MDVLGMTNHRYTVQLRIWKGGQSAESISKAIGLNASYELVRRKSSKLSDGNHDYWIYDGRGIVGYQEEWGCLDAGLNFLLTNLDGVKEHVKRVALDGEGTWWCGHFQSSFDGGPIVNASTFKRLAQYEFPVFIDNYFGK